MLSNMITTLLNDCRAAFLQHNGSLMDQQTIYYQFGRVLCVSKSLRPSPGSATRWKCKHTPRQAPGVQETGFVWLMAEVLNESDHQAWLVSEPCAVFPRTVPAGDPCAIFPRTVPGFQRWLFVMFNDRQNKAYNMQMVSQRDIFLFRGLTK